MYPLNINSKVIYFRDLKISHLPKILKWYNNIDEFRFATGIDKPISFSEMTKKYFESLLCTTEFFVGIYKNFSTEMIGILKGQFILTPQKAVWISSIMIDPDYQGRGLGREAINLLIQHLRTNSEVKELYLAVAENNIKGKLFWKRQDFKELKRIDNCLHLQNQPQNIIVMYRSIQ
ncbi:MAG: GNAT family N-acetyltransferase [Bacillota bacterium]